jgi:hypothetical protein
MMILEELAMRKLDRLSRTTSFALSLFWLLCAMAIGFATALRRPVSNPVDYGYDEQLGAQAPSDAKLVSNCFDKRAAIVGAATMDGPDELRAGAITARRGPPSTTKLQTQAIGGHFVE